MKYHPASGLSIVLFLKAAQLYFWFIILRFGLYEIHTSAGKLFDMLVPPFGHGEAATSEGFHSDILITDLDGQEGAQIPSAQCLVPASFYSKISAGFVAMADLCNQCTSSNFKFMHYKPGHAACRCMPPHAPPTCMVPCLYGIPPLHMSRHVAPDSISVAVVLRTSQGTAVCQGRTTHERGNPLIRCRRASPAGIV